MSYLGNPVGKGNVIQKLFAKELISEASSRKDLSSVVSVNWFVVSK